MSFYNELKEFISQSKKGTLTTSQYLNEFEDLKVKVSFGQGNQARVPWIAFLGGNNTVQNGIYPVYLYFKERELLILSYGVSETAKSKKEWPHNQLETISEFFRKKDLDKPERYGDSFVYMTYDTRKPLNEYQINNNLDAVISTYKKILKNSNSLIIKSKPFDFKYFHKKTLEANLQFSERIITRFVSALCTKPFVVLSGLSGSGKTKLAHSFATWLCEDEKQHCILPIGADWTNREPLLGFPNALEKEKYVKPDNRVLDIIIAANANGDKPYFLILDEMNLSHVERYFADFLSAMESKSKISLHPGTDNWAGVPAEIGFPKNLFIVGTVNIDETTYMFSPKVLDRANVIEFRVTEAEMKSYLGSIGNIDMDMIKAQGANMASDFIGIAKDEKLVAKNRDELNKALMSFFTELKKSGAEFGYRSASEIIRFAAVINKMDTSWSVTDIIDAAIMQKLLPKVHGSRRKLEGVLLTLAGLCMKEVVKNEKDFKIETLLNSEILDIIPEKCIYPVSFEKISRMYKGLLSNGFTSYAEA